MLLQLSNITILTSRIDPPSSPVVTLSQTDNSCSNTLISWSTPSSDRSVTSYSVYRDGVSVYNGTDNQYSDNTQLNINTVYEYSVVAISCAGNSTAGVMSVSLGGETHMMNTHVVNWLQYSGYSLTQIHLTYNNTTNEVYIDWVYPLSRMLSADYYFSAIYRL